MRKDGEKKTRSGTSRCTGKVVSDNETHRQILSLFEICRRGVRESERKRTKRGKNSEKKLIS